MALDTHTYDHKLDPNRIRELSSILSMSINDKRNMCVSLIPYVTNPVAIRYLQGIIASIGTESNIDKTNGINADDLLCICSKYKDNEAFIKELETQLIDMNTGFCPQGRTHRLYQIIIAFQDK